MKSTKNHDRNDDGDDKDDRMADKISNCFFHGMMLVCGPTGSGKTTTLYSIMKFIDNPNKNIVTVEDPVEFQLEGINQVTARPEIGLTFAGYSPPFTIFRIFW